MDIKRIDKITSTKSLEKVIDFSDLLVNLNKHPDTGFLSRNVGAAAVKRALRNLIMTNKGERLYQPDIGCNLRKTLFEDISPITTDMIRTYITDAINEHEPRVKLIDVIVVPNEVYNSYQISIIYEIINNNVPQSLSLTLYRVR